MAVAYSNTRFLAKQVDDKSSYIWRIGLLEDLSVEIKKLKTKYLSQTIPKFRFKHWFAAHQSPNWNTISATVAS